MGSQLDPTNQATLEQFFTVSFLSLALLFLRLDCFEEKLFGTVQGRI